MCCCKYLDNQTSCPSRQASSDGERARLMRRFVGEGRASIPIQMLPTCGFRSQELTACAHDWAKGSYISRICPYIHICAAYAILILQYYSAVLYYYVTPLISNSYISYSNNNETATKNSNGNKWNDHICQFSLPWFLEKPIGHIFAVQFLH